MLKKEFFTLFILIIVFLMSCEDETQMEKFGIYFLSDSSITYSDVMDLSLSKIKLKSNPVITTDDIIEYRIQYIPDNPIRNHLILLTEDKYKDLGVKVRPLVVLTNNQRIYLCEYWPEFSDNFALGITMVHYFDNHYDLRTNNTSDNDLINDQRIITTLENSGIEIIYEDISN